MANNITEHFDIEKVDKKVQEMEQIFGRLADTITSMKDYFKQNVNSNPDSALFGEYGDVLLQTFEANIGDPDDFIRSFDSWSQFVSIVRKNNVDLLNVANETYAGEGHGNSDINAVKNTSPKPETVYGNGSEETDGNITEKNAVSGAVATGIGAVAFGTTNFKETRQEKINNFEDISGNRKKVTFPVSEDDNELRNNVGIRQQLRKEQFQTAYDRENILLNEDFEHKEEMIAKNQTPLVVGNKNISTGAAHFETLEGIESSQKFRTLKQAPEVNLEKISKEMSDEKIENLQMYTDLNSFPKFSETTEILRKESSPMLKRNQETSVDYNVLDSVDLTNMKV